MRDKLKKTITLTIALLLLASAPAALADNTDGKPPSEEANVTVSADNMILYVPFRSVAERLGGIVEYEESLHCIYTVMPDETIISHIPSTNTFVINGHPVSFNLPSVVGRGVTYLPITVLNMVFNNTVIYDSYANVININTGHYKQSENFRKLQECTKLEHFIPDNLFRYLDYIKDNPDIPADRAAAYVNIGVQNEF